MRTLINNYARSSAAFIVVLAVIGLSVGPAPEARADAAFAQDTMVVSTILQQMNGDRAEAGLPALFESDSVDAVAGDRARRMAFVRGLNHIDPWGDSSATLLAGAGVPYYLLGENIGRTNMVAESVAPTLGRAWMQSDDHRANILDSRFDRVGIGIAHDGQMVYVSVIFLS